MAELPPLGAVGWARWAWRQLTSMRVALMLLLLLAVAAVPGSVLPQRPQDPARVATYLRDHPGFGPWLDRLGFFDVFSSPWFSAVYLLLFISLVGCIVPRARLHVGALLAPPPRAPRRFERFAVRDELRTDLSPAQVAEVVAATLRGRARWPRRFRVLVSEEAATRSAVVSAERGYLRETGNVLFHLCLVGLLVSVATGQVLSYRGQALVIEGQGFANAAADYDTFSTGALVDEADLAPFSLRLDSFSATFDDANQARDFRAQVTVTEPGGRPRPADIRVNHPLGAGGANIYLQGNGYAPDVEIRDAAGEVAFAGAVPFLPQDAVYTSRGVVKVPDVSVGDQIGLVGWLLPTAQRTPAGVLASVRPEPIDPVLVLSVWRGNLGLDTGVPQNAYELDDARMTQVMADDGPATVVVRPGETVDLPDGLGTLEFRGLPRFVALDLRHDPSLTWVLVFALGALGGLGVSLFTPRRRVWVRATSGDGTQVVTPSRDPGPTVVTAAALARGNDPGLRGELDRTLAGVPRAASAPTAPTAPAPEPEETPDP